MKKSLAEAYLDGDIEVEEYTDEVIAEGELLARIDLTSRTNKLLEGIGNSALEGNT